MSIVATIRAATVLLQANSNPTQLFFYAAWKRIIAENPIAMGYACLKYDGINRQYL